MIAVIANYTVFAVSILKQWDTAPEIEYRLTHLNGRLDPPLHVCQTRLLTSRPSRRRNDVLSTAIDLPDT